MSEELAAARSRLRRICLALPEAVEVEAWGDPTYRVRNKIFAMEKGAGSEVWLKGEPGLQEALVQPGQDRWFVPPYVGHKGWLGARLAAVADWEELAELIADSYRLVAPRRLAALVDRPGESADPAEVALVPIGVVRSPLADPGQAPKQADEGAPQAWLDLEPRYAPGLAGIGPGDRIVVVTWLHRAARDVLTVHPRGDTGRPLTGVFGTRSPARPNPIGLHEATVVEIRGPRVRVDALEAVDGTPVLDLKAWLGPLPDR